MEQVFRLFDFNVYNKNASEAEASSEEDGEKKERVDNSNFVMQIFGINEEGETCSILVNDYKPFFYVKVDDNWTMSTKDMFLVHLKNVMGNYYKNSIVECKLIKRKRLYGFDGGKDYKFVMIKFNNMNAFNKAKKLWFKEIQRDDGTTELRLNSNGYRFNPTNTKTELYESNIPPLLRFFHIQEISPSGWVALPNKKTHEVPRECKSTTCNYEFTISYKDIIPLKTKETRVPYKICSFDIEASSSHGDFPIPVKTYKKLAGNIVDYFGKLSMEITPELCKNILKRIMLTAFGFASTKDKMNEIDVVYPKTHVECTDKLNEMVDRLVLVRVRDNKNDAAQMEGSIESMFENMANATLEGGGEEGEGEGEGEGTPSFYKKLNEKPKTTVDKKATIVDILCNKKMERELKLQEVNQVLTFSKIFPPLEGDKVTFIGSTFVKYGEPEPYLNHCIALNTCDRIPSANTEIESYSTEKEVLLKWRDLIQKENPDIIIGYNIFGFDYSFMFQRAQECGCAEEFLKLSRNIDEVAASRDFTTNRLKIEESSISIASGTHELKYIKINGRIQVDMLNFFRREENLTSYKLDYVAGHFIGDYVKTIAYDAKTNKSKVQSGNLTGLLQDGFIHFEEIGHSTDYYKNGDKFKVTRVNKAEGWFEITGEEKPDMSKKVRWCLAKDDVSPKDIFRLTNGSSADRSIIAKYCIQDCNLVHYLFSKADVLTGLVEMSSICSVPMSFLIFRGQGIKLTSFVAKKCREKRTLMPVIEKGSMDEGYEGAIVLDPKCDLYLDNPVACVDFASLYPSAMMSENLSHDSKVWTKEYSLTGELVKIVGDRDKETGEFIYDNLPSYEYVNITYDTFKWVRKTPSSAAEKVKSGYKICRFAQFAEGRAIMPSILEELLQARKSTRKLIPQQTDDFMKNVLDKRQLAYKITANSLYGQCGAKTSTFYEKDIAASTTATGRLLLTYAKRMIEETYGDAVCNTKNHGPVLTKAEYIYGDTDSVFFTFNLQTPDGQPIRGKQALEITIELAQEAGHLASSFLKQPHDLEYEKTFMPFCLLSKKRYVGMLYEHDPNKGKRKEMGIVLKRRDNAPIVKDIYGGIIDILMKEQNMQKAIDFLKGCLQNIVDEKYPVDKLIISKSLNSNYKKPQQIAHKVLADRMASRDPGNKPTSGDRIPFVYIAGSKKDLQGDKIETPAFISANNLKIDYSFYITNQIMKPVQQLFALVLERIWEMQKKKTKIVKFKKEIEDLRKATEPEKFEDKLEKLRNKEVKALLFDDYLRKTNNAKEGNQAITSFWNKK